MANIQRVAASQRGGNQGLWAALGVDTVRTLAIAPVAAMEGWRVAEVNRSCVPAKAGTQGTMATHDRPGLLPSQEHRSALCR